MKTLPSATRKRLVLLIELLQKWKKVRITSIELSQILGCKDSLIRSDFSFIKTAKGAKNGYDVQVLKSSISEILCSEFQSERNCCVVGLGRLGAALLDNSIFEGSGFKICAGFDSSVNRVEMLRSTFELFPANRIETVCVQKKVQYAFVCCPDAEVEKMVQRLVNAGIKGIVNYTTAVFPVPPTVKVQNVSPITALMNM